MSTILSVQNLSKSLPHGFWGKLKPILKNVSFEIQKGEITGFIGVNGAGKTTSIKCILGFIFPDQGQIHFFNQDPLNSAVKSKLGYMPERPYFYDFLTGREFLKLHWDLSGYQGKETFEQRMNEVLEQVDLVRAKDSKLRSFSKGMLQRIGIAQSILHRPELLILDEPMSGLDPDGRYLVKQIMKQEAARGTTLFFISHLLQDMEEICNKIVVIDKGELLYKGQLDQFIKEVDYENIVEGAMSLEKAFQLWRKKELS